MRVLVLTTSARIGKAWVDELTDSLAVDDLDLRIVALTRPAERLPVARCLVVGPSLRPFRVVRDMPTLDGPRTPKPTRPGRAARALDRFLASALPAGRRKDRQLMLMTGTLWSRCVREEFAAADLVIAHDYNTTWAAWRLARRIAGPDVVFQVEGAALKLAERAEASAAT
jgi:hypothetical protein